MSRSRPQLRIASRIRLIPVRNEDRVGVASNDGIVELEATGIYIAWADGFSPHWCEVTEPGVINVALTPTATIVGTVVDVAGDPVVGLTVTFSTQWYDVGATPPGDGLLPSAAEVGIASACVTDQYGAFKVANLAVGAKVFCHLDTIDYRIADFGMDKPLIVHRRGTKLDIRLYPVYVTAVIIDGWPDGNSVPWNLKGKLPPGVHEPVERRPKVTSWAQFGQPAYAREKAVRAAQARGFPLRGGLRSYGLYYGKTVAEVKSVLVASGWEFFTIERRNVRVPVGDVTFCMPSKLTAEMVTVVDIRPHLVRYLPDRKAVKIRFLNRDGSPARTTPPISIFDEDKNRIGRATWLTGNSGFIETRLPPGRCRIEPNYDSLYWSAKNTSLFSARTIDVSQDGDIFEITLDETVRLLRLRVRDARSKRLLPSFGCRFPKRVRRNSGGFVSSVGAAEVIIPMPYEPSMTFEITRWIGWGQRRVKEVTIQLDDGLNDIVLEL